MKLKAFAVYDSKVGVFAQPFFMRTAPEAIRGWVEVANDKETAMGLHPADFTLFELAEYDGDRGTFENHPTPISHGTALEFVRSNAQPSLVAHAMRANAQEGAAQ